MAESLQDTLRRLEREREEADRRYNDALTAVDRALPAQPDLPQLPPAFDDRQLAALNDTWNIIPSPPSIDGLKQKLAGFVWRIVAPYLQRQLTFNSQLVDHLNRTAAAQREAHRAAEQVHDRLREHVAAAMEFNGRLLVYLQQITAYVDTKDRDTGSAALVLNAALSGTADANDKRWESLSARVDARTNAIASSLDALKTTVGVSQQAALTLKRELERVSSGTPVQVAHTPAPAAAAQAFTPTLDAYKYVGFEDRFRGSRDAIRERLESYIPIFRTAPDGAVLDVGCGRGEFLELLAAEGIAARGIDLNHEMAELCRARGLDVSEADAVGYLDSLSDASLAGIFAAQVVEHLQPAYLLRFLELAFHKVRPGGRVVLETLNPACWVAFFDSYIRDITHAWPLHPDTLRYLVLASGFTHADVEYRSPVPEQDRLQRIPPPQGADRVLVDLVGTFNENVDRLNARMFTHLDYAVVASR